MSKTGFGTMTTVPTGRRVRVEVSGVLLEPSTSQLSVI